jgi:hypothetical protein
MKMSGKALTARAQGLHRTQQGVDAFLPASAEGDVSPWQAVGNTQLNANGAHALATQQSKSGVSMGKNGGIASLFGRRHRVSPRLPHERDESGDSQGRSGSEQRDNKVIKQAHDDIVEGKKDTDLHGTPGLDKPTK